MTRGSSWKQEEGGDTFGGQQIWKKSFVGEERDLRWGNWEVTQEGRKECLEEKFHLHREIVEETAF